MGVGLVTPSHCLPKRKDHTPFWGGVGGVNKPVETNMSVSGVQKGRGRGEAGRNRSLQASECSLRRTLKEVRNFHRRNFWGAW